MWLKPGGVPFGLGASCILGITWDKLGRGWSGMVTPTGDPICPCGDPIWACGGVPCDSEKIILKAKYYRFRSNKDQLIPNINT